jgi:hypothetical protein
MTTPENAPQPADEERSLTKRMLALIHRFDAEERRSGAEPDDGSAHQRRRDDEPTPTSLGTDDLIVKPAQPE